MQYAHVYIVLPLLSVCNGAVDLLARSSALHLSPTTTNDILDKYDLTGKTYLITGSNSGIGFEAAKALALKNARIIMACRDMQKAEQAKQKILESKSDAKIDCVKLDMGELTSVEQFAKELREKQWKLDALILNAGILNPTPRVGKDGFETTFQVNHLAQFYLIKLILDDLIRMAPVRVVIVSSRGHRLKFYPDDVTIEKLAPTNPESMIPPLKAYDQTKLCNVLFSHELNRRYAQHKIYVNSLHPGIVRTNIGHTLGWGLAAGWAILSGRINPWAVDCDVGASTMVYVATAKELEGVGGWYFERCQRDREDSHAQNEETAKRLWDLSEQMIDSWKSKRNSTESQ